jgi:anti-sigma regulatory factor (Ser/Thr protein kinase)
MTIRVKNQISEIERLSKVVADFSLENGLSEQARDDVTLALDEMLANVILHGLPDSAEHEIIVQLYLEPGYVAVVVEDEDVPFNPLEAPEPDLTGPIEARPIGDLGIHLVRNFMDKLEYHRQDGRN